MSNMVVRRLFILIFVASLPTGLAWVSWTAGGLEHVVTICSVSIGISLGVL